MNIHQQPETYQLALFLHCIGPEALKIFNGMPFDNSQEREKLESIIKKIRRIHDWRNQRNVRTLLVQQLKSIARRNLRRHVTSVSASENRSSVTGSCGEPKTRKQEKRLLQERKLTPNIGGCQLSERKT